MADKKELIVQLQMENSQFKKAVTDTDKGLKKTNESMGKGKKALAGLKTAYLAVAAVLVGAVGAAFKKNHIISQ